MTASHSRDIQVKGQRRGVVSKRSPPKSLAIFRCVRRGNFLFLHPVMIVCVQCRFMLFLTMRVDKCMYTSKCAWANYVQPMLLTWSRWGVQTPRWSDVPGLKDVLSFVLRCGPKPCSTISFHMQAFPRSWLLPETPPWKEGVKVLFCGKRFLFQRLPAPPTQWRGANHLTSKVTTNSEQVNHVTRCTRNRWRAFFFSKRTRTKSQLFKGIKEVQEIMDH